MHTYINHGRRDNSSVYIEWSASWNEIKLNQGKTHTNIHSPEHTSAGLGSDNMEGGTLYERKFVVLGERTVDALHCWRKIN